MRKMVIPVALLGAVLTAGGCGFAGAHGSGVHGGSSAGDRVGTATAGSGGVQHITVKGDENMQFTPNVIKAHPGKLEIRLVTTGATPHDLEVTKLHATTGMVKKGKPGEVEVDLSSAGRYDFVCTYHTRQHMTGVIEVS
ncbi:hypothetical protein Athai_00010 [Actinocatenispora thailandica]|uniref:EfeO-type cupredoxin-like domain-containing protein n=1 Tax=Actinocatenispora thailandica TaxID=227318 RepID=A0A7R7HUU7_9ACTN|nr:hypothetical protein Athai_00010 [Actinocatenispora thailandica]